MPNLNPDLLKKMAPSLQCRQNAASQRFNKSATLFVVLFIALLLQSCQRAVVDTSDKMSRLHQADAASYNTQLGLAYLNQGNIPRAKQKLLTAQQLSPKSSDVNSAMAYFYEKTGDKKQAAVFYKKALALASHQGAALNNYGAYLCRLGQYREAEQFFLKAVNDRQYIHTAGAYENAGLCVAAIPDYPKAVFYLQKSLAEDPSRKQALIELTRIQMKENKPDLALQRLNQYPQLVLNDLNLLSLGADAATAAGKNDIAADYKSRLIKLTNQTENTGGSHEYHHSNG